MVQPLVFGAGRFTSRERKKKHTPWPCRRRRWTGESSKTAGESGAGWMQRWDRRKQDGRQCMPGRPCRPCRPDMGVSRRMPKDAGVRQASVVAEQVLCHDGETQRQQQAAGSGHSQSGLGSSREALGQGSGSVLCPDRLEIVRNERLQLRHNACDG
ncbi:hypothetical protein BC831DRAFT_219992 [Entophlyctis helioformis]|nr:hypothetical protein BC831DRAFT_219992 [Entophlyctis helioformis]